MAKRVRLNSARLSALLAQTRLSQNAWARRLGISKSYLSQLANGRRLHPSAAVRERLLATLRVPFHELFEIEAAEPHSPDQPDVAAAESNESTTTLFRLAGRAVRIRVEPLDSQAQKPGDHMLQILVQDIRYGLRVLIANPGFSLACLALLALGIGANTTLYSLVHGVLLKPLPLPESSRLVTIWETPLGQPEGRYWVSPANFLDWKEQSRSFQSMAAYQEEAIVLTGFDEPRNLRAVSVSDGFLEALGATPALGRFFSPDEFKPGSDRVVLVSASVWRTCFGGGSIKGQKLTLDGNDYQVVGVVAEAGRFPAGGEVWIPMAFDFDVAGSRGAHYLKTIARLLPNVGPARAQEEMDLIAARLRAAYPDKNADEGIAVIPLQEDLVSEVRPTLLVLWVSVTLILLIACANAANLFLARSLQRRREIAIRLAMGAARSRIVRQLLTESLLLALAAGAAGVALAYASLPVFLAALPFELPRSSSVEIDTSVLLYTLGVSMVCGIAFGLVPAGRAWGPHLRESLTPIAGASLNRVQSRFRNGLVVVEVALAVTLVISAGLFLRALQNLQSVEPGFDPSRVVSIRLSLPDIRYDAVRKRQFYRLLSEEIESIPGVASVGTVAWLPLGDAWMFSFEVEGQPPATPANRPSGVFLPISGQYFKTMGIQLLRGREFGSIDRADSPLTIIVNQTLAKRFFPNQDPIGKRITIGYGREKPQPREIVGVVGDVKQWGLGAPAPPCFYLPHQQVPFGSMQLVVRSDQATDQLVKTLKTEIWKLDPELALSDVQTLSERVHGSTAGSRFRSLLVGSFGLSAALLALFGIYGVISFTSAQRSREIGIRMALGARSRQVVSMVLQQGLRLALVGTILGMALAWAVSGSLSRFLFGIGATDPATYLEAGALIAALATLASYLPARRASQTDPATVLRHE